ncbi:COBRA-like extracellular glycosyl-phosphatidyl inositol-anchored protein family [Artemisia annua]|uniref:COBRA-like extracellular glycosyl-phosphatidyl inositol-anchored protein family n=1 Tax=Artemisia annua TaxID=35608 RepID=A0A2U1KZQ7_ARTAN|nr:COBRA-like extracellular glycosyl-phosphatidyl inositol-anchored protein family [Artemisia annua]
MSNVTGDDGSFSSREEGPKKQTQELENHFQGENSSSVSASLPPPPPKKKRNLPGTPVDPNGNITIKWDIISWTPDGYVAVVTMYNFQQYRHISPPG